MTNQEMQSAHEVSDRITEYLEHKGPMSKRDVCSDLGLEPWDVSDAYEVELAKRSDYRWARVSPVPGGTGTWFGLSRGYRRILAQATPEVAR